MDYHNFVKDNKNTPMPSSFSAFHNGGENVKVEGRNSNLVYVIENCRKEMQAKLKGGILMTDIFEDADVIFQYTEEEAVEDGFLVKNPRADVFDKVAIITNNLWVAIQDEAKKRSQTTIFGVEPEFVLGCALKVAKEMYEGKKFEGDNDKDFFVLPKSWGGLVIWCVRNENGKLTMMLPEDY